MKLKNHNKLSKVGYLISIVLFFCSLFFLVSWGERYFFTYPDINIAILGVLTALLGLIVSIILFIISLEHSRIWNLSNTISYIEEQLQSKWEERK